jgi:hypothetical protein
MLGDFFIIRPTDPAANNNNNNQYYFLTAYTRDFALRGSGRAVSNSEIIRVLNLRYSRQTIPVICSLAKVSQYHSQAVIRHSEGFDMHCHQSGRGSDKHDP